MDLKDEFYEDELSWYCELYEFWTNDSCYLYDHPFGSICLFPMMAIMQQRVKSKKRRSLTWRPCPKGVDLIFNKGQVHGPPLSMAIGAGITAS
jgi:hypothetical protein